MTVFGALRPQQVGGLLHRLEPAAISPLKHQISHRVVALGALSSGDAHGSIVIPAVQDPIALRAPAVPQKLLQPPGACALRKQTPQAPIGCSGMGQQTGLGAQTGLSHRSGLAELPFPTESVYRQGEAALSASRDSVQRQSLPCVVAPVLPPPLQPSL